MYIKYLIQKIITPIDICIATERRKDSSDRSSGRGRVLVEGVVIGIDGERETEGDATDQGRYHLAVAIEIGDEVRGTEMTTIDGIDALHVGEWDLTTSGMGMGPYI